MNSQTPVADYFSDPKRPKKCKRCGIILRGEYTFATCRNTEACKRRVLKATNDHPDTTAEVIAKLEEFGL